MPRFFVDALDGETAYLTGEDARHLVKSLRMRVGERVVLCDRAEVEHTCEITRLGDPVVLRVCASARSENEPTLQTTLFQAIPKGDKFPFIIQKTVELGVHSIVPVLTERCVSRPDARSMESKRARYNKIALEAAKQCGRGVVPTVEPMLSFSDALERMREADCAMLFYELSGERVSKLLPPAARTAAFMIGSEGGFSDAEIAEATARGIPIATLGKRILRCETAPLVAQTVLMYLSENL